MTRISMTLSALALLVATACGGNPDEAATFVGTWQYTGGTTTLQCPGVSRTGPLTGTETIAEGSDSDLIIAQGTLCVIKFDVMGEVATARPGQSCEGMESGVSVRRNISALNLLRNGTLLTLNESSTMTVVANGRTLACSYTSSGTLSKLTK